MWINLTESRIKPSLTIISPNQGKTIMSDQVLDDATAMKRVGIVVVVLVGVAVGLIVAVTIIA